MKIEEITALIDAEMEGVERGYSDRRGEMLFNIRDALAEYEDKIEGLKADLDSAVEVAYKRGAVEWTRLNYPDIYKRLNKVSRPYGETHDDE